MPPPSPVPTLFPQNSTNNTNLRTIPEGLGRLLAEQQSFFGRALNGLMSNGARTLAWFRSTQAQIPEWFQQHVPEWLKNRRVWKILLAQGVAFGVVVGGLSGVGFGSAGIGAGTLAAAWQSAAFGGFTPAMPGLFATLQSMGMTGALGPAILGVGLVVAVVVGGYLLWRWYREDGDEEDREDEEGEENDDEYDYDREVEDDDRDVAFDIEEEDDIREDVEDEYYNDDTIDQEEDFYATRLNGEDRDDRKWGKGWRWRNNFAKLNAGQIQQE